MMLIWEVLETLFRWGIAGGSGDYGHVLGDWDLVLVSSSLGISAFWLWNEQPDLTCSHDVLSHQGPSVGGAKDQRLTSLRWRKYMGRASGISPPWEVLD